MVKVVDFFTVGAPTPDQSAFFEDFSRFVTDPHGPSVFVLRGYAGTGKTTSVSAILPWLRTVGYSAELLAPTGRAAKVLQQYTGKKAMTIHRRIYSPVLVSGGGLVFRRTPNRRYRTVFIVDEASMISGAERPEDASFGGTHLLRDLIDFCFEGNGCFLLLVGDVAQLPPVGEKVSPALSPQRLLSRYECVAWMRELTQVTRQAQNSGILRNATKLRSQILAGNFKPVMSVGMDVLRLQGHELEDALFDAFREGDDHAVVITPTNKRANAYNRQIRFSVYGREGEIDAGDKLMVVKNNYFWLPSDHPAGFVANGDTVEVMRVLDTESVYGLRFARVDLRLSDYPDFPNFEAVILLDVLHSYGPALAASESDRIRKESLRASGLSPRSREAAEYLKQDCYLQALQVKYAYAVTGHKAQGGQWPTVFVDAGYLTEERMDLSYMRWLYTSVTRASLRLCLLSFPDNFFEPQ